MAKQKKVVARKMPRQKTARPLQRIKINESTIAAEETNKHALAGKHLADALGSFSKAVQALQPQSYTTSWWISPPITSHQREVKG